MADQKPVDSAQIVLDKRNPSPASGGARCSASSGVSGVALKVIAVAFVVCNVTALYVLHFVNRPTLSTALSTSNFVASAGTEPSKGDVVSMAFDNTMRNGAGTTAYLSRTTIVEDNSDFFEYVNLAKPGVSKAFYTTNLLSYRCRRPFGSKNVSVLTTATYDPLSKSVKIDNDYDATKNVIDDDAIRGVVTLSDTQAMILTVDDATFSTKTYVMPAAIYGGKATLDQSKKTTVTEDSSTNFVTRLSDTTAVVAYYELYDMTNNYFQYVKVAKVAADGTIMPSAATKFGPANNIPSKVFTTFGKPVALPSKDGAFAIPYYLASSDAASKNQETGLCVTMATYSSNVVGTFTSGVCNSKFRPAFYPEAIMLSDHIMLIAFHDDANNNALTLTTLHVTATTAHFRTVYVFPEVAGPYVFGSGYGFSPEISLALLSGNRVAVSFLNPSMDGKQSVKVLQYSTETLTFKDATPVLPVSASSFTLDDKGGAQDKSVTQQVVAVTDDSVVAMYVGKRGDAALQHVSVVEVFGAPVGVLRSIKGYDADVVMAGKAKKVSKTAKLIVGKTYYATTMGYVVKASTSASPSAEYFVASDDAKVLVTADSKIGVAVNDDTLFVSTAQ